MFSSQKRIFAGKQRLQPEPFCPYITDSSGRSSLKRSFSRRMASGSQATVRFGHRDGKRRFS